MVSTRHRLVLTAALLAAGLSAQEAEPPAATAPRPPNVLLIVADDLGYGELGSYGGTQIPTPHLDALAKAGARCTDCYVTCPVCAPTRAGLLTGRYQQRFGLELNPGPADQAAADYGLPAAEPTLAERMLAAGYRTGMVGKWHLGYREGSRPTERGFQEYFGFLGGAHAYRRNARAAELTILRGTEPVDERQYLTAAFAREAVAFVRAHRGEPFFLYLAFNAVHAPLQDPLSQRDRFAGIEDPKRRTFAGMLAALDDAIGEVLAVLQELELEQRTLVLFVSDNGGPTPSTTSANGLLAGTKGTVREGGIRVPCLLRWPGRIPAGHTFAPPCSTLDLHATALAAAGVALPEGCEGKDLLPFLRGEFPGRVHEALCWRFGEQRAVRLGDLKLLQLAGGEVQLFDLAADPGERTDLAAERPDDVKRLEAAYAAWNEHNVPPRWRRGRR